MNFLRSGWTYLSSSFTQSDDDPNESRSEEFEEGIDVLANENWQDPHIEKDDLAEFLDAVDTAEDRNITEAIAQTYTSVEVSQENDSAHRGRAKYQSNFGLDATESSVGEAGLASVDTANAEMDLSVEGAAAMEVSNKPAYEGYSSLEASDSDDSGELIPPPVAPVRRPADTDSQLNQIIKNLGGDLDILTLEDENHSEVTFPGEKTFGETLYLTAYDQTICPPSPENEDVNSFSVTAIEEDLNLNGKTSPDSAIASSSKSSICSIDSVKLNTEFSSQHERPATPLLKLDALNAALNDTSSEQPFASSILDTTVKEEEDSVSEKILTSSRVKKEEPTFPPNLEIEKEDSAVGEIREAGEDTEEKVSTEHKIITSSEVDKEEQTFQLKVKAEERETSEKEVSKSTPPSVDSIPLKSDKVVEGRADVTEPSYFDNSSPKTKMDDPIDEIPLSRGAYTIDFDNLDDFNPFQSSKAICNSPDVPSKPFPATHDTAIKQEEKCHENNATETNHTDVNIAVPDNSVEKTVLEPKQPNSAILDELPTKLPSQNTSSKVQKDVTDTSVQDQSTLSKSSDEVKQGPEDEVIPISRGSYTLDFDNLENFDPFKTSKGLQNSPTKPKFGYTVDLDNMGDVDPFKSKTALSFSPPKSPVKNNVGLLKHINDNEAPNVLPEPEKKKVTGGDSTMKPQSELIAIDSGNLENVDPAPAKKLAKKPVLGANRKKVTKTKTVKKKMPPAKQPDSAPSIEPDNEIIVPKGSYSINFDDLESIDPFKTSKGLCNSPTKNTSEPSFTPTPKIEDVPTPVEDSPGKGTSVDPPTLPGVPKGGAIQVENYDPVDSHYKETSESSDFNAASDAQKAKKEIPATKKKIKKPLPLKPPLPDAADEGDEIPLPKGTYNLDFDKLESIDPFKTSKGLANSPTEKKFGYSLDFDNLDAMDPFKPSKQMTNSPPLSPTKSPPKTEGTSPKTEDEKVQMTLAEGKQTENKANKSQTDEKKSETKPKENKKPRKKPSGLARKKLLKPELKKPALSAEDGPEEEPPLPRGSYNLDFDNLDAMDPFKSSKGLAASPTKDAPPGYSVNDMESIDPFKPRKTMINSPPSSPKGFQREEPVEAETLVNASSKSVDVQSETSMREATSVTSVDEIDPAFHTANETADLSLATAQADAVPPNIEMVHAPAGEQNINYKQLRQLEHDKMNEDEEFYPASSVFQDSASLAYLDRLGGAKALTASDLKKQSLYVKFDPLVSDSPQKLISQQIQDNAAEKGDASNTTVDLNAQGDHKQNQASVKEQSKSKLITASETSVVSSHVSTGVDLHTSMDPFNQPYLSQQSFGTALKYTQADLDAALRKAEQEWEAERNENLKKEEAMKAELEQMTNVVKEYDRLFAEMSGNGSRNGMLSREQQLLKAEHEQSLEDMAALERSHEDLCRRYNRLKAVVAQFKQNEDILKKSTNEMMEEARATEKKYITLKVKADEEIKKASSELQFVKANAQQEVARAQAQLKMLELKCESLQSQIRDCNKENEELTKLCDDLIACSKQAE